MCGPQVWSHCRQVAFLAPESDITKTDLTCPIHVLVSAGSQAMPSWMPLDLPAPFPPEAAALSIAATGRPSRLGNFPFSSHCVRQRIWRLDRPTNILPPTQKGMQWRGMASLGPDGLLTLWPSAGGCRTSVASPGSRGRGRCPIVNMAPLA